MASDGEFVDGHYVPIDTTEGTNLEEIRGNPTKFQTFLLGQGLTYAINERTAVVASDLRTTRHGDSIYDYRTYPASHHVGSNDPINILP